MEYRLRRVGPLKSIHILRKPDGCRTKTWVIGRSSSCDIYTESRFACAQHFSITFKNNTYYINDLRSLNGTYLNNSKVRAERLLPEGSVISVGTPSMLKSPEDLVVYMFELHSVSPLPERRTPIKVENVKTEPLDEMDEYFESE